MAEHHEIAGPARGEPLPAGREGACIRIPLDSAPTARWSHALAACLANRLVGHPAVGHLHLDRVVEGADIVLEGVEAAEAGLLGPVLRDAVRGANQACDREEAKPSRNMNPAEAAQVAKAVDASLRG